MTRVLVAGGYGTFGSWVCRELVSNGVSVTVAGRSQVRAQELAGTLGPAHAGVAIDLRHAESCVRQLQGHAVAINCAGPFQGLDATLLQTCVHAGCHYVDIADDRGYLAQVRRLAPSFVERGLVAAYGCSSLPAISGALAQFLRSRCPVAPERVRVTLFIGNDNPKGEAAVASLFAGLGQAILAPQGVLIGGRDRTVVPLPAPFGRRVVLNFDSPDYDLLPALLGVPSVSVKVGFELALATELVAWLASLRIHLGRRATDLLARSGARLRGIGCSGAAVMVEFFLADGHSHRLTLLAPTVGQRMAALPCALVAWRLAVGAPPRVGACTAYELLGAHNLLAAMTRAMPSLQLVGGSTPGRVTPSPE